MRAVRALLVANPSATTTTAAGQDVIAHALASEIKLDVVVTRYRGHAAELAARARAEAVDLVVVLGGDGTVNEALNGLLADGPGEHVPALGVVPGGSANVFARALGVPREPLEATHTLLGAIAEGRSRSVGLGRADERWFSFNAGLGWDADVIASMERARGRGHDATPTRYVATSIRRWSRARIDPPDLTVEIPGEEPVSGVRLALVSNTDPGPTSGPARCAPTPAARSTAASGSSPCTPWGCRPSCGSSGRSCAATGPPGCPRCCAATTCPRSASRATSPSTSRSTATTSENAATSSSWPSRTPCAWSSEAVDERDVNSV